MINYIRPRLVTFDITGTLLTTKIEEHYIKIGLQYGLSIEPRRLARSFKNNFARLSVEHPIYGKHTGLGWENWWRTIIYNVFRDQDRFISENVLNKVANSLISCYGTSKCWQRYPGTIELLDFLRKRNIILGVISNFDERLESILIDIKIHEYFSFILTSYDFGIQKPNVLLFEEALKLANLGQRKEVLSQEAMHIGDTVNNDYFGAKRAGWSSLLIKHNDDSIDENKVSKAHIFENLEEVRAYFDQVFSEKIT